MANQIIEVPDISVVKTVNGTKQLFSLRDQKVKKDGALHDFGTGSGIKAEGELYVLKSDEVVIPDNFKAVIKATTIKNEISFSFYRQGDTYTDWGDGTIDKNVDDHIYSDGLETHDILIYEGIYGINTFTSSDNGIISLDISNATKLNTLVCHDNPLTKITCSPKQELHSFEVNNCLLSKLDTYTVPGSVLFLEIKNNQISSFDMGDLPAGLGVRLRSLYLDDNTSLDFVAIEETSLEYLTIDRCTNLTYLDCSFNKLRTFSFSGCTSLKELYCSGNNISSNFMKVIDCPSLEAIDFSGNPFMLNETGLKNFANSLPDRTGKNMGTLIFNASEEGGTNWIRSICDSKNWGFAIKVPDAPGGGTTSPQYNNKIK